MTVTPQRRKRYPLPLRLLIRWGDWVGRGDGTDQVLKVVFTVFVIYVLVFAGFTVPDILT